MFDSQIVSSTAFIKPKANVYRSFLYLNGDEVINALSGLQGGDIDEVLTRVGDEGGGEIGGEIAAGPVRGKAAKKRGRRFEEEVRRKRTEHSAATTLLRRLHEEEAIGRLDGPYGPEVHAELEDHMAVEFTAEIRVHPLHQAASAYKSFLRTAPSLGVAQKEIRELTDGFGVVQQIAYGGTGQPETYLVFADVPGSSPGYRLVVPIAARHLLVPLDEFEGSATFVAQVDRKLHGDDEVLATRMLRNAPLTRLERDTIVEAVPALIDMVSHVGLEADEDDFVLRDPTIVLKPIVIYK